MTMWPWISIANTKQPNAANTNSVLAEYAISRRTSRAVGQPAITRCARRRRSSTCSSSQTSKAPPR